MRERTSWSREIIASKLRKVAEDPRSMNQDHIQRQPAADDYLIGDGSPSQFAEDVNSGKGSWKSEQGSDGQTKRNEIGFPEFRGDTFNNPESSPGVSPSRQASLSVDEIHERATLATEAARLMLPRMASAQAVEDQALLLMDMPASSLKSTLNRLAQQDEGDDDDDEDEDDGEGQDKQAQQDEDDEDDGQQSKQAKDLPPEFLENIQKKKDEAKAKDKDDKAEKKEARSRRAQDQDDEKKQSQQQDKDQGKTQQQTKEARRRKAQQQQAQDDDEGQDKEAADQDEDEKKQSQQQDKDKEACGSAKEARALIKLALIKQAAVGLLSVPQTARHAAFKAMLPMLMKSATEGLGQPVAQQQQLSQQQLQSQVQQLVQQAMQQQLADQQQQQQQIAQGQQEIAQGQQQQVAQGQQMPQLAQGQQPQLGQDDSQALVDQLFQEPDQGQQFFASDDIQMDSPTMDIGDVSFGPEDAALNTLFASEPEVQRAIQANALRSGTAAPTTRTASTRTVGTRPTEGVSHLGGAVSSTAGGSSEEINRLSGMWSTAPDVSGVFSS